MNVQFISFKFPVKTAGDPDEDCVTSVACGLSWSNVAGGVAGVVRDAWERLENHCWGVYYGRHLDRIRVVLARYRQNKAVNPPPLLKRAGIILPQGMYLSAAPVESDQGVYDIKVPLAA